MKMKKGVLASVGMWLLLVSVGACAEQGGKIAVATEGDTPAAKVSSQAGFSPFFLLFDRQGTLLETLKNPALTGGMGGGTAVMDFLANKGVKVIVAEGFGSRIVQYITSKGMKQVEYKGNAADAVKAVLQSK
jgi:predicted Fe-Mo cluster-binding NifX family protein